MNHEIEHQRRCDRDATILGLVYIGIIVGSAVGTYYYADYLNKNTPENPPSQLETRVQEK